MMSRFRLIRWPSSLARLVGRDREFRNLQRTIGYWFKSSPLLLEALSHRSFVKTSNGPNSPSFERLEFLGDSVLGMLVAEQLFKLYPEKAEGDLTKLKSALVNELTLAMIAKDIQLGEYILLSEDEAKAGGRERPSITSDCLEALIGAIYLDGGIKYARDFVRTHIISRISDVESDASIKNYKGDLLELTQAESAGTPHYEVVSESGPDHQKVFTVSVHCFGKELARGKGHSKKEAEQEAARKAFAKARKIARQRRSKLAGQEDS